MPIQRVINTMDRDLAVSNVETLRETIGKSTLGSEFNSLLVLGFAVIALVLAAAGLYGFSLISLPNAQTNSVYALLSARNVHRFCVLPSSMACGRHLSASSPASPAAQLL